MEVDACGSKGYTNTKLSMSITQTQSSQYVLHKHKDGYRYVIREVYRDTTQVSTAAGTERVRVENIACVVMKYLLLSGAPRCGGCRIRGGGYKRTNWLHLAEKIPPVGGSRKQRVMNRPNCSERPTAWAALPRAFPSHGLHSAPPLPPRTRWRPTLRNPLLFHFHLLGLSLVSLVSLVWPPTSPAQRTVTPNLSAHFLHCTYFRVPEAACLWVPSRTPISLFQALGSLRTRCLVPNPARLSRLFRRQGLFGGALVSWLIRLTRLTAACC